MPGIVIFAKKLLFQKAGITFDVEEVLSFARERRILPDRRAI